jgi:hypothetical protein
MRHRSLRNESLVHVHLDAPLDVRGVIPVRAITVELGWERSWESFGDVFAEGSDFTDFFEKDDGTVRAITVYPNT